jgi:hypothetical protein
MFKWCTLIALTVRLAVATGSETETNSFEEKSMFELRTYDTEEIEPLLPLLQEWGESVFIQYPYLWVPVKGEIFGAFALLAKEKNARVAVVQNQGKVVGLAAGVPFDAPMLQAIFDEDGQAESPLLQRVEEQGFDPSRIFYMSFFVTSPEYYNHLQIIDLIYNSYIDFIRAIGGNQLCYFDDIGRDDHPLKPERFLPIEPWGQAILGFKSMQVKKAFAWPTLQSDGSVKEETHQLEFFVKNL